MLDWQLGTRMSSTAVSVHAVGSKVWVKDPKEAWLKADVIALDGEFVKVRTEQGDERREKGDDCPRQNVESRPEEVIWVSYVSF